MEIAQIRVSGVKAELVQRKGERWEVPVGIIGGTIRFLFGPEWKDLSKTVVFQGCGQVKDMCAVGDIAVIPREVVCCGGQKLRVGVYGVDTDGKTATPTLWVEGITMPAADPCGDNSSDETLPLWAQMEARLSDLERQYGIEIDETLTEAGSAADAKTVGDRFAALVPLGYLEIDDTLTKAGQAADAEAVGEAMKEKLSLSGGTMTGPVSMGENILTGLKTPVEVSDAVPLGYAREKFAPAGYGLGDRCTRAPGDDLDQIRDSGFWYGTINTPVNSGDYWYGYHIHMADNHHYQRFWSRTGHAVCERSAYGWLSEGSEVEWEDWRWVTPLLQPGIEYKTGQMFAGNKPIYTMLMDCGLMANNKVFALPNNYTIRICAMMISDTGVYKSIPYGKYGDVWYADVLFSGIAGYLYCSEEFVNSGSTFLVQVWYVKE